MQFRHRIVAAVIAAVSLALAACGPIGSATPRRPGAGNGTPAPAASSAAPASPATLSATPGAPARAGDIQEGTWRVGPQVRAGTYVADVPADTPGCSWSRLRDFSGTRESYIETDTARPGAHVQVTILPTDGAFTSEGCGTWHLLPKR